jgi:hypothetical protein
VRRPRKISFEEDEIPGRERPTNFLASVVLCICGSGYSYAETGKHVLHVSGAIETAGQTPAEDVRGSDESQGSVGQSRREIRRPGGNPAGEGVNSRFVAGAAIRPVRDIGAYGASVRHPRVGLRERRQSGYQKGKSPGD